MSASATRAGLTLSPKEKLAEWRFAHPQILRRRHSCAGVPLQPRESDQRAFRTSTLDIDALTRPTRH